MLAYCKLLLCKDFEFESSYYIFHLYYPLPHFPPRNQVAPREVDFRIAMLWAVLELAHFNICLNKHT